MINIEELNKEISLEAAVIAVPNVGCNKYLTAGKEYKIIDSRYYKDCDTLFFEVESDVFPYGDTKIVHCASYNCGHSINGYEFK